MDRTNEPLTTPAKYHYWFDNRSLKLDLKEKSVKGGLNTIVGQGFSFVSNFASTMILARLLAPADFGLVAMVTSITGFVLLFKDMGLSAAIIQKENLEQWQVSAIFWLNVILSLVLAVLIAVLAPVLSVFYHEQRLVPITLAYSVSILIAGLSQQHNALLSRQMEFARLTKINIAAVTGSILLAIVTAYAGFGYWAIVVQNISLTAFTTVGMWLLCDWRPEFKPHIRGVKEFLHFGAGISGFNMINYFSRNVDAILIGKKISTTALGLYSKSYQLLMLPITQLRDPLNKVAIPAMSSLQQDPDKYQRYYRHYLFIMAFCSMPVVVFMAVYANQLVAIVLGKGWGAAAPIFQYLAVTAFIQPILSTASLALISTGQAKRYFILGLANSSLVVLGFLVGIHWGIPGITIAYAIVNYATLIPILRFSFKDTPLTVKLFAEETVPAAIACIVAGAATWYFSLHFSHGPFLDIIAGGLLFTLLYIGLWQVLPGGKAKMMLLKNLATDLLSKKKAKLSA
ncbi:MAG: lipopolysaccharide biosynthesis protein [Flavihumibacter sp.]